MYSQAVATRSEASRLEWRIKRLGRRDKDRLIGTLALPAGSL